MRSRTNDPNAALRARTRFWLSTALGKASRARQDAVVVHELLHLKVRNHGRVFKALMSAHLPGWRVALNGNCAVGSRD